MAEGNHTEIPLKSGKGGEEYPCSNTQKHTGWTPWPPEPLLFLFWPWFSIDSGYIFL